MHAGDILHRVTLRDSTPIVLFLIPAAGDNVFQIPTPNVELAFFPSEEETEGHLYRIRRARARAHIYTAD